MSVLTKLFLPLLLLCNVASADSLWKNVPLPETSHQFTLIDFADSLNGWVFSTDGVYAMTTDGGATWALDSVAIEGSVTSIKCFAGKRGWIVVEWLWPHEVRLMHTSDGFHWTIQAPPDSLYYYSATAGFAAETEILVAHANGVIVSRDSGKTWQHSLLLPYGGLRFALDFGCDSLGMVGYWRNTSGGETTGLGMRTTNTGATWDTVQYGVAWDRIRYFNRSQAFVLWYWVEDDALGGGAGIGLTNDGGQTLEVVQLSHIGSYWVGDAIGGVKFEDGRDFILFRDAYLEESDGGFYRLIRADSGRLNAIEFECVSENTSYILAAGNMLFQSIGTPTNVEERTSSWEPKEFSMAQNYPNPFNPSTHIRYDLPRTTHVHLEVFDLLGRIVAILVDETQEQGRKEVTFRGADLPSGVYFYRLSAGGRMEIRRMLLLR